MLAHSKVNILLKLMIIVYSGNVKCFFNIVRNKKAKLGVRGALLDRAE